MYNDSYWMKRAVEVSKDSKSNFCVGVIVLACDGSLVCEACPSSSSKSTWVNEVLRDVSSLGLAGVEKMFLTVNTVDQSMEFDLNRILEQFRVNNLYIGLPDPTVTRYLANDPFLNIENIIRFPISLQRDILVLNKQYYLDSYQSIRKSPYYSRNRISDLVIDKLRHRSMYISKKELNHNRNIAELCNYICRKYHLETHEVSMLLDKILSESFDAKYSAYTYDHDARSVRTRWSEFFHKVYTTIEKGKLEDKNILNVGVGGGNEAKELFSKCQNITFVDIAEEGLNVIKKQMPLANIFVNKAERLATIHDDRYDLYVSLRTYNSSFFDIEKAVGEAYRVLKNNGSVILSLANGFLCPSSDEIISGLIIPATEFVDIYGGYSMVDQIRKFFIEAGFKDIRVFPSDIEIYMTAKKGA